MTNEGSYQVSYQQGIAGESDAEILDRYASGVPQPLHGLYAGDGLDSVTVTVGTIPLTTCTNSYQANPSTWTPSGPLLEVEVGSTATFEFTDIENGECPYAIFVDSNQAKVDSGAAWTQF